VEVEKNFYRTLMTYREILEEKKDLAGFFAGLLEEAAERLEKAKRGRRNEKVDLDLIYSGEIKFDETPDECSFEAGSSQTLRAALGLALGYLNRQTGGAFIGSSADLLGSTSIDKLNAGFPDGFYNSVSNPDSRLIASGGICEDAMGGLMAGISTYGKTIGAGSSYGAFITSLQHITARLHGIGQQAKEAYIGEPYNTWILVNAHAGLKTGEDGPTHADPQCLQEIQENFPAGVMITLTPWDPNEMYPMLIAGLKKRPAVLAPFVTRPSETIIDREKMKLPPVTEAVKGVYAMRKADPTLEHYHGTLVLQGSGVTNTFVSEVLPRIDDAGYNMNIYYVSSAELFSMLPVEEQEEIFPEELTREAVAITGLTLPTMYRWVASREGRQRSIHAFRAGRYLGSGKARKVFEEANLHGEGQWDMISEYAEWIESSGTSM
jgi:transketolase